MAWYKNSEGRYGASGKKGDQGEKLVEEYCKENNISWEDKNDYDSQVKKKIDCVVDGVVTDVKTNMFKEYMCVELFNKRKNEEGWLYTTEAEQIFAVDLDNEKIFSYNIEDMKSYVGYAKERRAKENKFGDTIIWVHSNMDFVKELV